jgi:hypothetical protein
MLSRNCLPSPIRGSRKAVWGTPVSQCQRDKSPRRWGGGKVHHTCSALCFGIRLYEGDDLVGLQAVPVVPFVLLVEVDSSIFVDVISMNDIHRSGLRCKVYGAAIAKRKRKVMYWASNWLP